MLPFSLTPTLIDQGCLIKADTSIGRYREATLRAAGTGHATAHYLLNHYSTWGLTEDLAADVRDSALNSMRIVGTSYESYLSGEKRFASWNDPSTPEDETVNTFMTIAYKFFEHAENSSTGHRIPLKRMMALLQTFDEDMRIRYDQ